MNKEIDLSIAKKKDFFVISKIYMDEFSKPPFNEPWTEEKALKKINIYSKYCDIYKIVVDGNIVGFSVINPNYWCPGEVVFGEEFAIINEYKGKGIGQEVFSRVLSIYKQKGYKRFLGIVNTKSRALNLYKRMNMEECKEEVVIEKIL